MKMMHNKLLRNSPSLYLAPACENHSRVMADGGIFTFRLIYLNKAIFQQSNTSPTSILVLQLNSKGAKILCPVVVALSHASAKTL